MFLRFYIAVPELRPHVQAIMVFRDRTGGDRPVVKLFPPAPEQVLSFYTGRPLRNHVGH
ncbi:hypothetical protein [Larkinella soli]|uniref:hypothetical protein n=1 Tax=Larkinella soli TaxID=1770527 RepID=UPI0013E3B0E0|nr:hypothetical protein [Larkinella soli]